MLIAVLIAAAAIAVCFRIVVVGTIEYHNQEEKQ